MSLLTHCLLWVSICTLYRFTLSNARLFYSSMGNPLGWKGLRILFHSWCRELKELEIRNTPNCSHLALYQLDPPEQFVSDWLCFQYLRTLGIKWKDIAQLLLVSRWTRWTIWRQVRDLGIAEKTGFTNIADTHLAMMLCDLSLEFKGVLWGISPHKRPTS